MQQSEPYDLGYASVDPGVLVGPNEIQVSPLARAWGPATIKLHLSWLAAQLRIEPRNQFKWGRYDALCDLLAVREPVRAGDAGLLGRFVGSWRRTD